MKLKIPYSIRKSLIKILPFVATAIMSTACHKEPYDVVIDWNWGINMDATAQKEIIHKEINKKNVNMVFLDFGEQNLTNWAPVEFHRARDTLQTCLDIAPGRVRGMGTIYVNSRNGAHLPDPFAEDISGMALEDSIWHNANGWKVQRLHPLNSNVK